jgi:hypothetical protein
MNIRIFKQIEVIFLDLVIDLLSSKFSPYAVITGFYQAFKQRPVFVLLTILASTGLGVLAGYTVSVLTS